MFTLFFEDMELARINDTCIKDCNINFIASSFTAITMSQIDVMDCHGVFIDKMVDKIKVDYTCANGEDELSVCYENFPQIIEELVKHRVLYNLNRY